MEAPERISLHQIDREAWICTDSIRRRIESMEAELVELGFEFQGMFDFRDESGSQIETFNGMSISLFVEPTHAVYAALISGFHAFAYVEITRVFPDGSTFSVTNVGNVSGSAPVPGHETVFLPRCATSQLMEQFDKEVGPATRVRVSGANVAATYEQAYLQSMRALRQMNERAAEESDSKAAFDRIELDLDLDECWRRVEEELFDLAVLQAERFAKRHSGESFYAFGFDCNAEYGNLLMCANTDEGLSEAARDSDDSSSNPKAGEHERALRSDLKWSLADWKYHGFNLDDPDWAEDWSSIESGIERAMMEADDQKILAYRERFLETACRVLSMLSKSDALKQLNKASEFKLICLDHDEDLATGERRLNSIR